MSEYNDILNDLKKYILDENTIKNALKMKVQRTITEKPINNNHNNNNNYFKIKNNFFIPTEKDSLFWCFYILKFGDAKYQTLYNRNEIISRQIKIEYIEKIRKEKHLVKIYKFDTISNIENNLANDKFMNIKTFLTLCIIENINILFINNKTYYDSIINDSNNLFIIYCLNDKENGNYEKKYGFEINVNDTADNLKLSLYKIDNINKPVKTMSAYKVSELIEICEKLAINIVNSETGKTKPKKDLYESIIQYF